MAFLVSLCLVLVATLYGVCQAQCVIRTLVPMTMMDSYSPAACCEESCSNSGCTSAEDLNALLLLARALEMDRANNNCAGVDVNGLLKTLVDALVYTATCHSGGSQWPGHVPEFPKGITGKTSGSTPTGTGNTSPSSGGGKGGDGPLIDVGLLGGGDSNVADVGLAGKDLVGVGLGDTSSGQGGLGGLLGSLVGE